MYQKKIEKDIRSPLEYGLDILSGKWRSRIICLLGNDTSMRFSDLKENLVHIKDGVLASNLNDLILLGMIEKVSDEQSSRVKEYRITDKGRQLIPHLQAICRWADNYYKEQLIDEMQCCLKCDYSRSTQQKR